MMMKLKTDSNCQIRVEDDVVIIVSKGDTWGGDFPPLGKQIAKHMVIFENFEPMYLVNYVEEAQKL